MHTLDAAFVHVPRWTGGRREIMVLPLGVPAMANLLADEGRKVEILHLGVERELDASFSAHAWLQARSPKLVLLSLHWHPQTRAVIECAERVRAWLPDAKVVLGGLTATVFAREAMEALACLDGVVRGDGEEPVRTLAAAVVEGRADWSHVPNLVWRCGREVRDNGHSWALDASTAGRLRHADLKLLSHARAYVDRALYADFSEGASGSQGYAGTAYVNAGRGCHADCVSCGGASEGQRVTSLRSGILLYPLDKLAIDVRDAVDQGAKSLRMSFDPPPAREHIRRWFERIRASGHRLKLLYDFWYLPGSRLLDEMQRTFAPGSVAILSPECGSEQVRYRIRGMPFSNERLMRAIREAEQRGLAVHCFFSAGLPTETRADVDETARLIERIRKETGAAISVCPMQIDPASPMFLHPERYGVRLVRRTLGDFYDFKGIAGGPGYETDHFDEAGVMEACNRLLAVAGLPPIVAGN
ncbi:MAG: cobalamin B12-binding domain-containing protein [Deltaproteobacteria bacterium]|nr:cobalamin B12-binding domain-containing protein [Deltaproteobacteria bacterium]